MDPKRCQGVLKTGQCTYFALEHSKFCQRHGGNKGQEEHERESLRTYRVAQWQARIGEFADSEKVKSLREDIGVLRLVLEETLSICKDSNDLLMYASRITDTVIKIEKLVASCHRLETATGNTLDKQQALQFAATVVEIIGRHVVDADAVDAVQSEIMQLLSRTREDVRSFPGVGATA